MKITPSLSCKIYSGLNVKDAAKPLFFNAILQLFVFTAFVFSVLLCCLLSSCSASDDGSGSLTIAMPAASSSRSIASSGSFQEEFVSGSMTFSVYIRDSDNDEVEKYTGITPGTTLTIDQLRAGTYNIAIRGIDDGEVRFYGATEAVVKGGTENTARIVMEAVEANNEIFFKDTSGIDASGMFTTTVRITCKNGDSYLIPGLGLELYYDDGCSCKASLTDYFFEPGFTYTFELSVSMNSDPPYHLCTKSAKASKSGITFIVG